jgi:peptidoglycan/LPS O-acetylase OafA/YrhL
MNQPSERRSENNFNGLRLLLAILVLFSHAFELVDDNRSREVLTRIFGTLSFGEIAVDSFFLLSGYLITQSWIHSEGLIDYLGKRVLRIYPGFIAAAVISALVVGPLACALPNYFDNFSFLNFVSETLRLAPPATPDVFVGHLYPVVNGSLWTIQLEFRCYLTIALFGMLGLFNDRRKILLVAITATATYLLGCASPEIVLLRNHFDTIRLLSYFFVGSTFYLYKDRIKYTGRLAAVTATILCGAMFSNILAGPLYALLGGYLLFYFAFINVSRSNLFRTSIDISYGVYLYGWPIQKLTIWEFPALHPVEVFVLSVFCSCIAGYASWHVIEDPFLRLKGRYFAGQAARSSRKN